MFPKWQAVKSWARSIEAVDRGRRIERFRSEVESSDEVEVSLTRRGKIMRQCPNCRFLRPCSEHEELFK